MSLRGSAGSLLNYRASGARSIENISIHRPRLLWRRLQLRNRSGIVWRLWSGTLCLLLLLLGSRSGCLLRRSLHSTRSRSSLPARILKFFQSMSVDRRLARLCNPILVRDDIRLGWRSRTLRVFGQCEKLDIAILHLRRDQHYFVLRRKEIGKEFGLNDDRFSFSCTDFTRRFWRVLR